MADTKISGLPAATAGVLANEYAINEAGTTKKVTRAVMRAKHVPVMARRTVGTIALAGTTWQDVAAGVVAGTGCDLVLSEVVAGDVVEVGISVFWGAENDYAYLDVGSLVSAAIQNTWGADGSEPAGSTGEGVMAWQSTNSNLGNHRGGPILRAVVSGDLDSGSLTLRFRGRQNSAVNKQVRATTTQPFAVYAINHGQ